MEDVQFNNENLNSSSDLLYTWYTTLLHNIIMYFSTYFPFSLRGDVAIFLFWFGWGFVELVDIIAYVFHDTAWTLVKPQWRLFKAFGGGRGCIQSNLERIELDLSFRVVFSRIWGVSSWVWVQVHSIFGASPFNIWSKSIQYLEQVH